MTADAFWASGVKANEILFTSKCRVTRSGALSGPIDPDTGLETDGEPTVLWEPGPNGAGRCWFKAPTSGGQDAVAGDVVTVQKPMISLPLEAPALQLGDDITLTASRVPLNVGRKFKVTALPGGDYITIARYQVEEVIS